MIHKLSLLGCLLSLAGCINHFESVSGGSANGVMNDFISPAATCPAPQNTAGPASVQVSTTTTLPYSTKVIGSNIAVTPQTESTKLTPSLVPPRNDDGQHPSTLWDAEDIAALNSAMATNPALAANFAALKALADQRLTETSTSTTFNTPSFTSLDYVAGATGYPAPYVAAAGDFTDYGVPIPHIVGGVPQYIGDPSSITTANAGTMQLLAVMYALTGDTKYGEFVHQMLVEYAQYYSQYPHPPGWTENSYRSALDGRLTSQFLDDATSLANFGWAYDLIYDLPTFTAADKANVRTGFLEAIAAEFSDPILGPIDYISGANNRSAITAAAVLIAGYASDDTTLINNALYGTGGTAGNPLRGGGLTVAQWGTNIDPDGLWVEASLDYQTTIASCGVFDAAIVMEHHGMDVFGQFPLKRMLDSAIGLTYSDPQMQLPDLGNSTAAALMASAGWENNEIGMPYEYGYIYYGDSSYLPIIRNASQTLLMGTHSGPPSPFLNTPAALAAPAPIATNVNYYTNGYGVLRLPSPQGASVGVNQLLVEYASNIKSHGEPNGMAIDLYALGTLLSPLPGDVFPYYQAVDNDWYETTVASNSLVVDQGIQISNVGNYNSRTMPAPNVYQLVYGFSSTMGIQKVASNTLYTGVQEDRSVFMTPNYVADIFGAFSAAPHTYDLPWHWIGTVQTSMPLTTRATTDFTEPGYNYLTNVMHATTNSAWNASITMTNGNVASLWAAANPATEVITGDGYIYVYNDPTQINPPVILERQSAVNNAIYGNAIDISGAPYVTGVTQENITISAGFASLLRIQHGATADYAFSSFAPGTYASADGSFSTDALQAFVVYGNGGLEGVFIGGGTRLTTPEVALRRTDSMTAGAPGLVSLEHTSDGQWVLTNTSPTAASVQVMMNCAGINETVSVAASSSVTL